MSKTSNHSSVVEKKYLATKYALFNVYVSTLTLTSYPNTLTNSRVSSLQGLVRLRGKRKLNTQRWFWLIGPLWSQWSLWFDTLVLTFKYRGVCIPVGSLETQLIGKALTWLTSNDLTTTPPLGSSIHLTQYGAYDPSTLLSLKSFWLVTTPIRLFEDHGLPTFTLQGSHNRNRNGWVVLPGPLTNVGLSKFLFVAALTAYKFSKCLKMGLIGVLFLGCALHSVALCWSKQWNLLALLVFIELAWVLVASGFGVLSLYAIDLTLLYFTALIALLSGVELVLSLFVFLTWHKTTGQTFILTQSYALR